MNFSTQFPFGFRRLFTVLFLTLLALFALYLEYRYIPPQWIIADDAVGRFLAFLLINLGPEIAAVGIGVTLIEFIFRKSSP